MAVEREGDMPASNDKKDFRCCVLSVPASQLPTETHLFGQLAAVFNKALFPGSEGPNTCFDLGRHRG